MVEGKKEQNISIRGMVLEGTVKSAKAQKTVIVQTEYVINVPKYERYKKMRIKVYAHNPESINAKEGDKVIVGETRKISKTKSFIVISKNGETPKNQSDKK